MANINVAVEKTIADGYKLKFRTPCDSTIIEGLEVKYPAKDGVGTLIKKFVFKDAHGTELSGVGNLFVGGVMIEVLLDVTHSVAYIQNADTNSYVESVKSEVQRLEESQRQFLGVAGKAVEECERATAETVGAIEATKQATSTLVLTHDEFVSGGYVEALKEQNMGSKFSVWVGTTDEYNALPNKVNNCFYIFTDDASRNEILVQIGELEGKLAIANGNISNLITDVGNLNSNVATLQTEMETADGLLRNDVMEIGNHIDFTAMASADYQGCWYRAFDGEIEWFNPPMLENVEYRTTERHLGKPVYVKAVKVAIPATGQTNSLDVEGVKRVVEISGCVFTTNDHDYGDMWHPLSVISVKMQNELYQSQEATTHILHVEGNSEYGQDGGIAHITIKYTKE